MKKVAVIGAGNIGSRHLQGLRTVKQPLQIFVIDPSKKSLNAAAERFEAHKIPDQTTHSVSYSAKLNALPENIDLSIISTNSAIRKEVTESLLSQAEVRFIIFEKLLFSQKQDYAAAEKLLNTKGVNAWVNCSMRTMPFYYNLKNYLGSSVISYTVTGSDYGLVTNAIHYLDHMIYLTGCPDFTVDTSNLNPLPVPSKREGFLEFNGTLTIKMANGSSGCFTSFTDGDHPLTIDISSPYLHCISRESEKKAWISKSPGWEWTEASGTILYQSEMSGPLAEEIFINGSCRLPSYQQSVQTHLVFLNKLLYHLNKHCGHKYSYYPFT